MDIQFSRRNFIALALPAFLTACGKPGSSDVEKSKSKDLGVDGLVDLIGKLPQPDLDQKGKVLTIIKAVYDYQNQRKSYLSPEEVNRVVDSVIDAFERVFPEYVKPENRSLSSRERFNNISKKLLEEQNLYLHISADTRVPNAVFISIGLSDVQVKKFNFNPPLKINFLKHVVADVTIYETTAIHSGDYNLYRQGKIAESSSMITDPHINVIVSFPDNLNQSARNLGVSDQEIFQIALANEVGHFMFNRELPIANNKKHVEVNDPIVGTLIFDHDQVSEAISDLASLQFGGSAYTAALHFERLSSIGHLGENGCSVAIATAVTNTILPGLQRLDPIFNRYKGLIPVSEWGYLGQYLKTNPGLNTAVRQQLIKAYTELGSTLVDELRN